MRTLLISFLSAWLTTSFAQPGSLDPTFGINGKVTTSITGRSGDVITASSVQPDGKLVFAGLHSVSQSYEIAVGRYNINGTLDNAFDGDGILTTQIGAESQAQALALQPDGKIVVGGISSTNSNVDFVLIRVKTDGSLDSSFDSDGKVITSIGTGDDYLTGIELQTDGKIVAIGRTLGAGTASLVVVRYNSDGSLDGSFGTSGRVLLTIGTAFTEGTDLAIQPDGKMVVVGRTANTGGISAGFAVARLNPNGSLDSGFGGTGKFTTDFGGRFSDAEKVVIQPDGKILVTGTNYAPVGGSFGQDFYNVVTARYNPDGSLDVSFDGDGKLFTTFLNFPQNFSRDIALQNDGKILLLASSRTVNGGYQRIGLARYNANGTPDDTFDGDGKFTPALFGFEVPTVISLFPGRIYLSGSARDFIIREFMMVLALRNNDVITPCSSDIAPPVVGVKKAVIPLNVSGMATVSTSDITLSITDNCSPANINVSINPSTLTCAQLPGNFQPYISNTSLGNQNFNGELGMEFRVNDPNGIIVRQLGAFDHQGNGITGTQNGGVRVAIFNRNTRQIISGLDVTISSNSDPLSANHRMRSINPVTLAPGVYVIVAKGYNHLELNGNVELNGSPYPSGNTGGGRISFLNTTFYGENLLNGFSFPTKSSVLSTSNAFLAGTFSFGSDAPVFQQAYVSNTNLGNQSFLGELGLEFRVNKPEGILINQLGAFDHLGNGITGTENGGIRVTVFNKATRSSIPGLTALVVGNADAYRSNYRLRNITPVILLQGDYILVAKGYNPNELNGNVQLNGGPYPSGNSGDGDITFLSTTYYGSNIADGGAVYPLNTINLGTPYGFLAGTFNYSRTPAGIPITITARDAAGNISVNTTSVIVVDPLNACNISTPNREIVQQTPDQHSEPGVVSTFPNPSSGIFTVQLKNVSQPQVVFQVVNSTGKIIEQQTVNLSGKSASVVNRFDLSKQPSGLYMVRIITKEGATVEKVLIQR